jgi:hypothetical protein
VEDEMICSFCSVGIKLNYTPDGQLCDKCIDLLAGLRAWLHDPEARAALDGEA